MVNDPCFDALVSERDELRKRLSTAEAEARGNATLAEVRLDESRRHLDRAEQAEANAEALRCEALGWRKQAETREANVTIMLSLDTLRQLWAMVKPNNCNGYIAPED